MSYKTTKITDITQGSIEENARRWLTIIRYSEYGVVIQPQDDCEYRVDQIINDPKLLKKIFGPYYRKYLLAYVPVDKKGLMEAIRESILSICQERKIGIPDPHAPLKTIIDAIGEKGFEIGLFLSRINEYIAEPGFSSLLELEYLLENTLNFSVILFSEKDLTHPSFKSLIDKCSLLFDHIEKFPLYDDKDSRQFITYNNSMWGMQLTKKLENQILTSCGGYLWLISHIQRKFRNNPAYSFADISHDETLFLKLETIFHKFTPREQDLILKSAEGRLTQDEKKTHEYKYLLSINVLIELQKRTILGIPLLSLIAEKERNLRNIEIINNHIFVSGRDVDRFLTTNEKKFLSLLLSQQRKVILRDELARKIWGNNWQDKYSDWAIDRLAYRVRKKITHIGMNVNLLKTVKRKGFMFG